MTLRNVSLLAIAVMATLLMSVQQREDTGDDSRGLFFPDLKQNLDKLTSIEIRSASDSVQVEKQNGLWVLPARNNYPADLSKLSMLVKKLSDIRVTEKKTTRPENYSRLNVTDLSTENSKALLVSGSARDYEFSVLIGKSAAGRSGKFVRRPDDKQVWLIDKDIDTDASPAAWLEPILIDIDSGRINSVEQRDSSGHRLFKLVRQEEGDDFELLDVPEGRTLKYPSITNDLPRSLSSLRLQDVMPHRDEQWSTSEATETIYQVDSDVQLTVNSAEFDGAQWLHITANRTFDTGDSVDGVGRVDAATEFDSLAEWDFQVTSLVYEGFVQTLDDLLSDEEPEPE